MSKKNKHVKSQRKNEITKGIFSILEEEPKKSFNYKQLAAKLEINDTQGRNLLIKRLGELNARNRIRSEENGKYMAIATRETQTGRVDLTARGNAYVVVEGVDQDIFVPFNKLRKAFHGDIVEVVVSAQRNSRKAEGEIVKIVERKKSSFVGIIDVQKTFAFVRTTDFRMYTDIFVPIDKVGKAKNGKR